MKTADERFWQKVRPTGFCWEWTASIKPNGYGQFGVGKVDGRQRTAYAHRFAYVTLVGPIPAGMDLDHLCRNRACVNPDHLEPVNRRENLRRSPLSFPGKFLRRTHCDRGHLWAGENISYSDRGRLCIPCRDIRTLKFKMG